jgi:hypothetical protein
MRRWSWVSPRVFRRREWLLLGILIVGALALTVTWGFKVTATRRAILRLPPAERAELFRRTRAEADALCGRHESSFEEECRRHVELLLNFPECDEECARFARAHLYQPVR